MTTQPANASGPQPGRRRVSVDVDGTCVDVVLPESVPVASLVPELWDIAGGRGADPFTVPLARHLGLPGRAPLDPSLTLRQHGIRDGALLVLMAAGSDPAPVPAVDTADAAATTARQPWTPRCTRIAASLVVTVVACLVGALAVPGALATPHVLLAATAGTTAAAISARAAGTTGLLALAVVGALTAGAALTAIALSLGAGALGTTLALAGFGAVTTAARLAVLAGGLAPAIAADLEPRRTHHSQRQAAAGSLLTATVIGGSASAAIGVCTAVAASLGWPSCALAAGAAAALLLRTRAQHEAPRRSALLVGGTTCAAAMFVAVRLLAPNLTSGVIVSAAGCGAAAIAVGFSSRSSTAPGLRRVADIAEYLALAALIPLACWVLGLYSALRELGGGVLPW